MDRGPTARAGAGADSSMRSRAARRAARISASCAGPHPRVPVQKARARQQCPDPDRVEGPRPVEHSDWLDPLFEERLVTREGQMLVPDRPGLGITLSERCRALTSDSVLLRG
ncbi:hypothetical protein BCONGLO52_06890 [Brachybacterium conglomeratum]|uniref:Enolase C-terminal domain-containing protein n=1 Tax=Brachybacterium conglomeratum TaxID=47846 RepID=A0ABQ5RD80_9MICO|nr:hypothetical protein BCONGLO52_06890 [Brachybacterium conglomeratum]GLK05975.1 hypothetical protein GCM10017597_27750 [Brachybacterium conglomeratum]